MENKPKLSSLRTTKDFESLRNNGRYFHPASWLVVNFQEQELNQLRCAWTISRTIASATFRNRFRRWGREFFRGWLKKQASLGQGVGFDFNMIFRRREKEFYTRLSHVEFDLILGKVVKRFEQLG